MAASSPRESCVERARGGTCGGVLTFFLKRTQRKRTMRGILLWLIGIPIPIIILLYLFDVI